MGWGSYPAAAEAPAQSGPEGGIDVRDIEVSNETTPVLIYARATRDRDIFGSIRGVEPPKAPACIAVDDLGRPIGQPGVRIAVKGSTLRNNRNHRKASRLVVTFLKARNCRVICLDRKPLRGAGFVRTHLPHGTGDATGHRPLAERVHAPRHAKFFVGTTAEQAIATIRRVPAFADAPERPGPVVHSQKRATS